jgi:chloride channel protein, CIC family
MASGAAASPSAQRRPLSDHIFIVIVAIGVGALSALGAVAFRYAIRFVTEGSFELLPTLLGIAHGVVASTREDPRAAAAALPWYWLLVVPALGAALAAPLIHYLAREAKGHGVPEVMESIALRGGAIRPRVAFVKALASAFSIGSGGSVGREGPIVQIGAALGSTVGQLLRMPGRHLRTLVGCGAAAGIAAAFNAPIAGALFAVEVILGDFAVPQFSPIVISSVVATVVSRLFYGDFPAFRVPSYQLVSPFELGPYMLGGVLAGLVGVAFIRVLYASEDFFERLRIPELLKLPLGGLCVGAIGIFLPHVYGVGYSTINDALTSALPLGLLLLLLGAKIVATSLTLGSGGSGGIFAPSLFLGAMTGGALGTLVHQIAPGATASSGAYALVVMGAVVAATTHAPITAIIIIFELTKEIAIVPPLMASCVISTIVSSYLHPDSIYTLKLRRRGLDPFAEDSPNVLQALTVRDVIDRKPEVLAASQPFAKVLDLVVTSRHTEFFVVDAEQRLLGSIALAELRRLIFERDSLRNVVVAADLLETTRPIVTQDDPLDWVVQLMSAAHTDELAVVDSLVTRKLVGSVEEREVVHAYNQEVLRRDLAGGMTSRVTLAGRARRFELGGGYVVAELPAPRELFGRSLRELDLRRQRGVEVLFIRRRTAGGEEPEVRLPEADERIGEGDALVLAGLAAAIDGIEAL